MTRDQLLSLPLGTILHHRTQRNSDGSPLRARVNGRPKLWKRQPEAFQLPVKYGLRTCFYITPQNLGEWELPPASDPSQLPTGNGAH